MVSGNLFKNKSLYTCVWISSMKHLQVHIPEERHLSNVAEKGYSVDKLSNVQQ